MRPRALVAIAAITVFSIVCLPWLQPLVADSGPAGRAAAQGPAEPAQTVGTPPPRIGVAEPTRPVIGGAVATPSAVPLPSPRPDVLAAQLGARFFGAYDPGGTLLDGAFGVEMFYTDLSPRSLAALDARLAAIGQRGRTPLVTLEPFPLAEQGLREDTLLIDLAAGRYDAPLAQVAGSLRRYDGRVFVRFAHEMDLSTDVYPWGGGEPAQYIAAYRHAHALLRGETGAWLGWVWSPAGNANAAAYYPGDDVVDFVGITLLGSAEFDTWSGATQRRSFRQLLDEKYPRARAFGKPVLIAELGVSGAPELQAAWLRATFRDLEAYPDVRGVIYFNSRNAINALVPDPPDYTITNQQWWAAWTGGREDLAPVP